MWEVVGRAKRSVPDGIDGHGLRPLPILRWLAQPRAGSHEMWEGEKWG